jgi:hypothetical protein
MSAKNYTGEQLARGVFLISIAAVVGWIVASFVFVITRHP